MRAAHERQDSTQFCETFSLECSFAAPSKVLVKWSSRSSGRVTIQEPRDATMTKDVKKSSFGDRRSPLRP
jgi:hypothetical protein